MMLKRFGTVRTGMRAYSTAPNNFVRILEAGPRDGLQNEKSPLTVADKVELINRLSALGYQSIEGGSFVSPKWVPQMNHTDQVLAQINHPPGVRFPVLTPNLKAIEKLLESGSEKYTDEIAVFVASTDSFNKANINSTTEEALAKIAKAVDFGRQNGFRVRGYVSTVIGCPFEGNVDPERVAHITQALTDMGCYEVSLGDTIGVGDPQSFDHLFNAVVKRVSVDRLAIHAHNTYGTGVANVLFAVDTVGVRAVDSSIAGLGGCPYAPGATGNVPTEDVLFALHRMGYETGVDLEKAAEVGQWISQKLNRENASRAGPAIIASAQRQKRLTEKQCV